MLTMGLLPVAVSWRRLHTIAAVRKLVLSPDDSKADVSKLQTAKHDCFAAPARTEQDGAANLAKGLGTASWQYKKIRAAARLCQQFVQTDCSPTAQQDAP